MKRFVICASILAFSESGLSVAYGKSMAITIEDVQKHSSADDCWMVISNKVYDLTKFIVEHKELCDKLDIAQYCGKDGTEVWTRKEDGKKPHKKKSKLLLKKSLVGELTKTPE